MLVLLVEYIFLTTFYGLYFNHQFYFTITILQVLTCSLWPSVSSFHVLPLHLSFSDLWVVPSLFLFNLVIFIEKFSPLPGFEPGTSPVPSRNATNWAILARINKKTWFLTSLLRIHKREHFDKFYKRNWILFFGKWKFDPFPQLHLNCFLAIYNKLLWILNYGKNVNFTFENFVERFFWEF